MRGLTQLLLLLLGTCLALWLINGFWPLTVSSRVALSVLVVIFSSATGYVQWHKQNHNKIVHQHIVDAILPPEDFQGAVVLVCGDSEPLFSVSAPFRETIQGWYLPVSMPEQLPMLAQHLSAERPALISQISVLLSIVPEKHQELDDFTQSLRVWHRAIAQCKDYLVGIPPLFVGTWVAPPATSPVEAERWYTATPGQKGVQVQEIGSGVIPLAAWSQQQNAQNERERLGSVFWIESLLSWLEIHVWSILSERQGDVPALAPCAWGSCFTSVAGSPGNLWQRHIAGITTLMPAMVTMQDCLPLPDVLLANLPRRRGVSRMMQDWQKAGFLCGVFLLLAMLASFINNQRMVQSVGDHLSLYNRLTGTPTAPKILAQQQLRKDASLLDEWRRSGTPMRLSLGFYQGMRLIAPLESAINSWTLPTQPSPTPQIVNHVVQGPKTIRLDSLSLFDVGKFQLKPGSTKMLVNTLIGIKAKPGWLIVVAGHTDITGNAQANQTLSLKRAEALRDWMLSTSDVSPTCFAVQGYGATRPIATNDTPEGRALNRRVEISLVPQANACLAADSQPSSGSDEGLTTSKEK
ncbi:OmpA family protein [Rouxiella sp. Mn2063]|uniref:OmpA family protein n=1 Tax=Rouxiella sp. Mn2063 TaxID=3395262 RepID=UPI003BBAF17D